MVYGRCSQAVRTLRNGQPFTELDVVEQASDSAWTKADFKKAINYANKILSALYTDGKVVRFGPVMIDGERDYVRFASRIVYADADLGQEIINTPNGDFPRLFSHEDFIASVGRRRGSDRDDSKQWTYKEPVDLQEVLDRVSALEAKLDPEAVQLN